MRNQAYLNICGVPTKVVTWGKGLVEISRNPGIHDIVLMIPGNPGFTPFYEEFLQEIYNRLHHSVWIIGHAGHEVPKDSPHQLVPTASGNEALYNVPGQVTHKVAFIDQYVPMNARLYLVGHSAGAYMILQLLKVPNIAARVVGSYLLFPVFERIHESPNGFLYHKLTHLPHLLKFLSRIFTLLPVMFQTLLMQIFGSFAAIPEKYRGACIDLIHPVIVEKMISLLTSELMVIRERDTEILKANKDKIKIYYGATDGWTPQEYYLQLKRDLPDVDAELCTHNYNHSFVLQYSKEVAGLVADWITMKK